MPTAPIRSKACRSPADNSAFANYRRESTGSPRKNQRLQISARTTTAASSSPTNRIMMVPIWCGELRNGIGSVLSGRTLFMQMFPPNLPAMRRRLLLVAIRTRQVQKHSRAVSVLIQSEPGALLCFDAVLTRFLDANRYPPHQVRGRLSLENALTKQNRRAPLRRAAGRIPGGDD